MRSRKPTQAVPFQMDTGRGLKNVPINRFCIPVPAKLNVLADEEPKSSKPMKRAPANGKISRPDLLSPTHS